jgi:hypothetical protein
MESCLQYPSRRNKPKFLHMIITSAQREGEKNGEN